MKNRRFILSFMVHTRPEEEPEGIEEILEEAVERIAMDNPGILLNPAPVIGFSGIREHAAGGVCGPIRNHGFHQGLRI
uniref:Uncharacterized protein n=1 Tax=Candidatus Kentrum sp. LFY TaxID=2126342 RepID=A0A450X7E8_9GAMM|nr:MAG: hypothetical protein BECKLFY1418C_GA0070996_12182 [Candidatus Kentron sp. LFY]